MAILPILTAPDPLLKKKSVDVTEVNDNIRTLLNDMVETMYDAPGIGLAAPQVGVLKNIIVIDVSDDEDKQTPMKMINPKIMWASEELSSYEEGCLSVPGIYDTVTRAERVTVEASNEKGEKFTLEADGLLAICIQHELDHLLGKVFVEYLSPLKQNRIKTKLKKRAKHDL